VSDPPVFDPPDDAAYGRVTRPERYAPLQSFARQLVDDLVEHYDAEIRPEPGRDPESAGVVGSVRVCPGHGDGGCLTLGETPFPGVVLGLGRWHWFHYPRCGCDACDEQVDRLTLDLALLVDAYVNGRFTEYLDGGRLGHRWSTAGGSSSGWTELGETDSRRSEVGGTFEWAAWPRRS
jgi:hypothetical protein